MSRQLYALILSSIIVLVSASAYAGDADVIVTILNKEYGAICKAELKGFLTKTLKVDWTPNTKKLQAVKVLSDIGSLKDKLYKDDVRYFQFPNDNGTYNVVDWKTGEKKSIKDKAPYFFN
jgi:hypothetical protein